MCQHNIAYKCTRLHSHISFSETPRRSSATYRQPSLPRFLCICTVRSSGKVVDFKSLWPKLNHKSSCQFRSAGGVHVRTRSLAALYVSSAERKKGSLKFVHSNFGRMVRYFRSMRKYKYTRRRCGNRDVAGRLLSQSIGSFVGVLNIR